MAYLPKAYATRIKDDNALMESTSGGAFTAISDYVLKKQGYIVGATFDNEFNVVHIISNKEAERDKMRGAKYVQSTINNVFRKTKELLDSNKFVLFTGTPCQVHALKLFLKRSYLNLLTIDIVCHGVSSPHFFKNYVSGLTYKYGPIVSYKFRSKSVGWRGNNVEVSFADGKTLINSRSVKKYSKLYSRNLLTRDCCFQCPYSSPFRVGDITIGDCWGVENDINTKLNDNKGCSLVIVNTNKGEELFNCIKNKLIIEYRDIPSILQPNLYKPTLRPKNIDKVRTILIKESYWKQ